MILMSKNDFIWAVQCLNIRVIIEKLNFKEHQKGHKVKFIILETNVS